MQRLFARPRIGAVLRTGGKVSFASAQGRSCEHQCSSIHPRRTWKSSLNPSLSNRLQRRLLLMLWTAPPPARKCHGGGRRWGGHGSEEAGMRAVTTIGLDIAKSVFQVHGVDAIGNVVIRRQLKRRYVLAFFQKLAPCVVGIEACATSQHWSRELKAGGQDRVMRRRPRFSCNLRPVRGSLDQPYHPRL